MLIDTSTMEWTFCAFSFVYLIGCVRSGSIGASTEEPSISSVLGINIESSIRCGQPTIRPMSYLTGAGIRIVGGKEAIPHSWPWMLSLQNAGKHWCGASLLSDQWLITAAHCNGFTSRNRRGSVVLGAHSISAHEDTKITVFVDDTIIHPEYRIFTFNGESTVSYDVMLVHLSHPVPISDIVMPVCLPQRGQHPFVGQKCYTTGWGRNSFEWTGGFWKSTSPDKLHQVMMPIQSTDRCNSTDWYNGAVQPSMMCAGYERAGRGNCHYDSGGPLVCHDGDSWYLAGIVSWADPCARSKSPTVYADVEKALDWIYQVTENY